MIYIDDLLILKLGTVGLMIFVPCMQAMGEVKSADLCLEQSRGESQSDGLRNMVWFMNGASLECEV